MKTFLVSRTDAIGDVVLTLPLCGWIKEVCPGARVIFLGRTYTAPVAACCRHIDHFINADELQQLPVPEQVKTLRAHNIEVFLNVHPQKHLALLAKKAGIPERVGTRNRWFHWFSCNRLIALSRRKSPLHESQLNLLLLPGESLPKPPPLEKIYLYYGFDRIPALPDRLHRLLSGHPGLNIILHPKSKGHGREWDLEKFGELAHRLQERGHRVFVTGTSQEREVLSDWLSVHAGVVTDLTGQLALPEFISFIAASDGLVASSTGPLHLAAAAGTQTLGLFPPLRPVHPGRWAPLGKHASYLVVPRDCDRCRGVPSACACINEITVEAVVQVIKGWKKRTN
jgi:heptosyltransferase-3